MSAGILKSVLAEVWYLVVVLVVIALVVVYKLAVGGEAAPVLENAGAAASNGLAAPNAAAAPVAKRLSEEEKARATIASHQKKFEEDAHAEDAPSLLLAIGNLNKQKLRDYREAARNYELLIKDYPDWVGISGVYPQLMSCYELLEDSEGLRWLYKEMSEKFPPESNEYKYAQAKLNL